MFEFMTIVNEAIGIIYKEGYLIFVSLSKQINKDFCFIINDMIMDMINFDGLLIGIATFLIIGLFHPVVVKAEYYWGTKCWWIFLLLGIIGTVASLFIESVFYPLSVEFSLSLRSGRSKKYSNRKSGY